MFTVIQGVLLATLHPQEEAVVKVKELLLKVDPTDCEGGDSSKLHVVETAASCVIRKVCVWLPPSTVIVPTRRAPAFAATLKLTPCGPEPVPAAGAVIETYDSSEDAFQVHPAPVAMLNAPVAAPVPKDSVVEESE